ncbi:MAG: hypothetical protein U0Q20_08005 [Mycobacterium sp.]
MFPALIPALLMLGTFGLERVESALGRHDDTDAIDELVAHTPSKVDRPPQQAARAALSSPSWSSRLMSNDSFAGLAALNSEPGLPTRLCRHETANPQFQATRHANPV